MSVMKLSAIIALATGTSMASAAVTHTFQNNTPAPIVGGIYGGTQDVTLYGSSDSDSNTGSLAALYSDGVARSKFLLKFDVSALAGEPAVQSATLHLAIAGVNATDVVPFSVYQVADANAGWQEGVKVFATATAGETSWNYLSYNTTPWAGSAGLSTADVDYISTPVATGNYTQGNAYDGQKISITLPGSLISQWIANPSLNGGVLIYSDVALKAVQFYSSENGHTGLNPALDVTLVPEPGSLMAVTIIGAGLMARRRHA